MRMDPKQQRAASRQKDEIHPEVEQVLKTLKSAIRILGYTVRDLEKQLGYSYGYMSRVFSGTIELKVEHVIEIAGALGISPDELWAFVYPVLKDPPSPAAYELWKRVGGTPPTGTSVSRKLSEPMDVIPEEALERALRRTLGRVLGDVAKRLNERPPEAANQPVQAARAER
jgi:transcriptional regulator with XRE-family HTH domain